MTNEKQISGNFFGVVNAKNIVFIAMFAVGILCIFMSARNTASYLLITGMDGIMALLTGIALIIFSSTSFTAAQLFLYQKGLAKLFSLPFVLIGVTVITFSMFSTLSLNYSKFIGSEAIKDDIADKVEKRRSEIMAEYQNLDIAAEGQDLNQWVMQNMDRFISLAESTESGWSNSMRVLMETAQTLSVTEAQKQQSIDELLENIYIETIPRTFFGFMLSLNSLDSKYFFDFFMIAIPAVFYDLIAPLAVTVVLLLMGFRREEKTLPTPQPEESKLEEPKPPPRREKPAPKPQKPPQPPGLEELKVYIESAMQDDFSLLPDDAIGNIEERQCRKFREYLSTFTYKDKPIIKDNDGRFVSIFDRKNLKRFIELYCNTTQKTGGANA